MKELYCVMAGCASQGPRFMRDTMGFVSMCDKLEDVAALYSRAGAVKGCLWRAVWLMEQGVITLIHADERDSDRTNLDMMDSMQRVNRLHREKAVQAFGAWLEMSEQDDEREREMESLQDGVQYRGKEVTNE